MYFRICTHRKKTSNTCLNDNRDLEQGSMFKIHVVIAFRLKFYQEKYEHLQDSETPKKISFRTDRVLVRVTELFFQ